MIVVVDYKAGNTGSIINMLKKIGAEAVLSSNKQDILKADKLILPGVGSFDHGMKNLKELGLIDALNKKVLVEQTPILGICLGVQLFTKKSEEGSESGLGWFDAETVRFNFGGKHRKLKIPHMGWNDLIINKNSKLFIEMYDDPRYYFVHSYHLKASEPSDILVSTVHGYEFPAGLEKENIAGVQFHPEKSHKFGMKLLQNFVEHFGQ